MKKRRIIADPLLMLLTILVVTGFQLYWLRDTYDREKRTLQIKTDVAFQEAVRRLQAVKLRLKTPFDDSTHAGKIRVFMNEDGELPRVRVNMLPQKQIVTMVNAMRDKIRDSSAMPRRVNSTMMISTDKRRDFHEDTINRMYDRRPGKGDEIFQMLYGVDSLQDTLRVTEIDSAYRKRLKTENILIPYTIVRLDSAIEDEGPEFSNATVGFARPITYHLEQGNMFPYLLKKIMLPLLFSLFLVGVTIFSFLLLYRNLMRQQRLTEIKNEFISNITHELKTPIATVGVAIEALRSFNAMADPARTREYLDISANELQRLGMLVDKVLKLSMFEMKEVELKYENVNMKDLIDEVTASMRLQIERHRAAVTVTANGDLNLEADRLHLLSVVFNLLDNALKYSAGEPSIHIDMKGTNENVQLSIKDNGIGIAPEYKDKVFEKFFRVPTGNTHNAKGYGLGLSYAAHVVRRHAGTITVESQPGIGTVFTIVLPKHHT
jgi:two-component system phosphate regulon sensor histidine kinase PhoR